MIDFSSHFQTFNKYNGKIPYLIAFLDREKIEIKSSGINHNIKDNGELSELFENNELTYDKLELENLKLYLFINGKKKTYTERITDDFKIYGELFLLKIISKLDSATRLYNKASFLKNLSEKIYALKTRHRDNGYINLFSPHSDSLSLIMFDIDHF